MLPTLRFEYEVVICLTSRLVFKTRCAHKIKKIYIYIRTSRRERVRQITTSTTLVLTYFPRDGLVIDGEGVISWMTMGGGFSSVEAIL